MVNTTGLVIVVSGLYGRDVEFKNPKVCDGDGDGVIEGPREDVEGGTELVELLSWKVEEEGVVEGDRDGGSEVEEGIVEVGSSVLVLGDWLREEEGDSLSAQISRRILRDGSVVHTLMFQTRDQGVCSRRCQKG